MQRAIEFIKSNFQVNLGQALNLRRVSAPLFVDENSGLNDNLNGVERPVSFDIPDVGANGAGGAFPGQVEAPGAEALRVQCPGKGLFTDMNAIRRDEEVDNLHSIYVDQWDWEKVISPRRTARWTTCAQTVRAIVGAVVRDQRRSADRFPQPAHQAGPGGLFRHHPGAGGSLARLRRPEQREDAICKEHHTVFLMQIGDDLQAHRQAPRRPRARTTTTGPSTAISLCGTTCWSVPLRSPPWASAWTRVSMRLPAAQARLRGAPRAALPQDAAGRASCP